jgi:hypothetical protein
MFSLFDVSVFWIVVVATHRTTVRAFCVQLPATAFAGKQCGRKSFASQMVRNIDYPEALVFYGPDFPLPMESHLLEECRKEETPVFAIGYDTSNNNLHNKNSCIIFREETASPPNPKDIWEAIHSIEIQPQPFGGSSGFSARLLCDPPRTPLPARVVVFCSTFQQTQAARTAGTRVISCTDNALADAVMANVADLWLEDIATPGSFWLNPPHPKDDHGNRVDIETLLAAYDANVTSLSLSKIEMSSDEAAVAYGCDTMNDDELAAILADMDPL